MAEGNGCTATVTVNLGEHPAIGPMVEIVQCMRETQCEFEHFGWFQTYMSGTSIQWDDKNTGRTFEVIGSKMGVGTIDYITQPVTDDMILSDSPDCDNATYCLSLQADVRRLTAERDDLLDAVAYCVAQGCEGENGELDSMALSTYRDALVLLAGHGRVVIDQQVGRRIIAHWNRTTP